MKSNQENWYRRIICFTFIVIPLITQSQTVIVPKDSSFEKLAAMQIAINKKAQYVLSPAVQGFRLQLANTQSRDEAVAVKADLLRRFPELSSYLLYKSPNFIVRIGNFVGQKEAIKFRKKIAQFYPNRAIYIVPDIVNRSHTEDLKNNPFN